MRVLLGILAAAAAGLSVLGTMRYGGSKPLFALFCACYLALAALALPRPRPYGLLFLALFLLLGFWLKAIAHFMWQAEFVEPVGAFGFKPPQWDAALFLATAGAGGALAVRVLHLWLARRRPDALGADAQPGAPAPAWFIAWRRPVWIVTLALIVAFNALNFFFSIYQVGVNPKVVLPLRLNVPMAWLVNIGFALWLAALVWWDSRSGKGFTGGFLAAMFEALAASMSAHSRFFFLLHAGPYWLVGAERWRSLRINLRPRAIVALAAAFVLLLVISLATISRMRFQEYFDMPKLPPDYTEARYYREVVERQLGRLVVQRWVGLEGSLIAVSAPGKGPGLFAAVVADNPRLGADSLFQKLAKVPYATTDPRFTFLTNAGPVGVLALSGSAFVVFLGMALLVSIVIAMEHAAWRFTANPFFCAVAGAGLANVASQMTFPYLAAVFLLQLLAAIAFVAALQRVR